MQFIIAAGLLGALVTQRAPAGQDVFTQCDGYAAPGKSDGFLTSPLLFGLATQSDDRRPVDKIPLGTGGAQACDAALADVRLKPEFTARRTNLYLAKAMHLVAASRPADALITLDAEKELAGVSSDPLRERGLGIAARAVRALALIELGKTAEGLPLVEQIEALRPYAAADRLLASRLRGRITSSFDGYLADVRANAAQSPSRLIEGLIVSLVGGRMGDAVALGRGLTVAMPEMRGNWQLEGGAPDEYDAIALRAEIAGMLSYALVASGQGDEADARLAAVSRDLDAVTQAPPPPEPGQRWKKSVELDYNARLEAGGRGRRALDGWNAAIALRRKAAGMTSADLFAAAGKIRRDVIGLVFTDVVEQLHLSPQEEPQRQAFLVKQREAATAERGALAKVDYATFLSMLPRPETPGNQPRVHKAGDGYFLSDNGYSSRKMDVPDRWTVRFTSAVGTAASVDEQGVASAAALAKANGYTGFVIETRRNMQRTLHERGMYVHNDINSGREVQMTVRFIRAGQMPEDLRGAEWRMLDADKVLADFSAEHPDQAGGSAG